MNANQAGDPADDEPFVREICGDSLWDEVLAQPPYDPNRPPRPPLTPVTAHRTVQLAQDAWNSRDPDRVLRLCTPDGEWRIRTEWLRGPAEIQPYLQRQWARELDYRLQLNLWSFHENRLAVRSEHEFRDADGQWWRALGTELWELAPEGLVQRRFASSNDLPIAEQERRLPEPAR